MAENFVDRAAFQDIAKGYARLANALVKLGKLEEVRQKETSSPPSREMQERARIFTHSYAFLCIFTHFCKCSVRFE